ncbi:FAS1 domain-containing protein SELMODRAFT_448915 [Ricinus communis]|uniref:FAS1 domain-containing protein n=1 Tax=Ricinus communis TaxID=3988 RepID=B9S211_RICCO|nr:FAS1 domain-containing protein SELMODRAFT_448915 [Ricinus communis]EEF42354.1 conserved hypothetical protein [Ricinus communis]|eukprot:XP_002520030.1 FAS1 domain-containing protein SELMODRAFT_448915 [Ricinus communis]
MATNCITASSIYFLLLIAALTSATDTSKSHELDVAIDEMTTANYFTFVTLINMSPLDHRIQGNITFLMPNDRILSKSRIPQKSLADFLLHHSIPSPLLFDHLQHIPSGSTIPSSDPDYMLDITNKGRRNFFLNDVRIISPNICTAGSSIRCHGIDGVLAATRKKTLPSCPNTTTPVVVALPPATALPPAPSPVGDSDQMIMGAPQPVQHAGPRKSSGSCMSDEMLFKFLVIITVSISVLGFNTLF